MIYTAYQAQSDLTAPMRAMSGATARLLTDLSPGLTDRWMVRSTLATTEIVARWGLTHRRPAFGIDSVVVEGGTVAVREEAVLRTPFGTLLRFAKDDGRRAAARAARRAPVGPLRDAAARDGPHDAPGPRRLHHRLAQRARRRARPRAASASTSTSSTSSTSCARWARARTSSRSASRACPALAAAALMAEDGDAALPRSLTLMAGPIDARIEPDDRQRPRRRPLDRVVRAQRDRHRAAALRGAGRRVYPGFVQVAAFMRMNPERHRAAFRRLYDDIVAGERGARRSRRRRSTTSTSPSST